MKKKYKSKLEWWRDTRPELDIERVINCDIAYWIKYYFFQGVQPKQQEFFQHTVIEPVQHVIFVAGRQTGKTWCIRKAISFELFYGTNINIVVLAPTMMQAKDNIFNELVKEIWSPQADPGLKAQIAKVIDGHIWMKNGNKLTVMTAAPESNIRGASPSHIIIDETQSIKEAKYDRDIKGTAGAIKNIDFDEMERALLFEDDEEMGAYMLEVGDESVIWETGTPLGRGHFPDLVERGKMKGFPVIIEQPWWDSKISNRRHIAEEQDRLSQRDFEAEYCCVFNVDEDYVFEREHVINACVIEEEEWKKFKRKDKPGVYYFYGVDLGQRKDHTVFFMLEVEPPKRKMVYMKEYPLRLKYRDMAEDMNELYQYWQPQYGLVDCTGKTGPAYEHYILPLGWNGAGMRYDNNSKGELMNNMKLLMENGDYILWKHDVFRKQLSSVKEESVSGLKYPQYPKPEKCHDDIVQACGLASTASMIHLCDYRLNTDVMYASIMMGGDGTGLIHNQNITSSQLLKDEDWGEKELDWGMLDSPWADDEKDKNVSFKSIRHKGRPGKGEKWW